jgi:selenocysteine-specific elongation factor
VSDTPEDAALPYRIVGTAGHIDHGKSALVEALTGVHPDRLREEIERGITIDLGFADSEFGGFHVAVIDVPGHERFVKNMLAGVGGIDAVLLAIAADESVMPQTREHLAICELLGVDNGVVALTKCDMVDGEIAELAELEVAELLEGTALRAAPIVRTSATAGVGLDDLRTALTEVLSRVPGRESDLVMRLPIDRIFTIRGFGTVVTGTLLAGQIDVGDKLEVLPGGAPVSVRGLQVHGAATPSARAGQRVAVNLHGVNTGDLQRGMTLGMPGELAPSHILDVRLEALPGFSLEHMQRVRFHHGAAELLGRVVLMAGDATAEGLPAYGQIRLEAPYPAIPGDRVVLRRYSPIMTIAGATVLDAHAGKRRRGALSLAAIRAADTADAAQRVRAWIRAAGPRGVAEPTLARRLGLTSAARTATLTALRTDPAVVVVDTTPPQWIDRDAVEAATATVLEHVTAYHQAHPLRPGIERGVLRGALDHLPDSVVDALIDGLVVRGALANSGAAVALASHQVGLSGEVEEQHNALLAAFARGELAPPTPDEIMATLASPTLARELFHLAIRQAQLVRITDQYVVTATALAALVDDLRARLTSGATFTISDFKAWTGLSRRHSIPMLEHLDATRVTRREGDARVLT